MVGASYESVSMVEGEFDEISEQESIDLDTNEDFKFLNYLLKNESK